MIETNVTQARASRLAARMAGLVVGVCAFATLGHGQDVRTLGSVTKLPVPRFVSLKPSDTPMREGPSKEHRIKWVFKREGLPVEVVAEHEQWRRVRDSESTEGWVYSGRLSNRRTAIVLAGKDAAGKEKPERELYLRDSDSSGVAARLQAGVIANIENCSGQWCRVNGDGFSGFMKQDSLWGVYAGEKVK